MPCSLSTIKASACLSGIAKEQSTVKLLQLIAQLTCEAGEGGGGGGGGGGGSAPLTITQVAFPALPYVYTSTVRAIVEVGYRLTTTLGGASGLQFSKTGATTKFATQTILGENSLSVATFRLGPGDSITITDVSVPPGAAVVQSVDIYSE